MSKLHSGVLSVDVINEDPWSLAHGYQWARTGQKPTGWFSARGGPRPTERDTFMCCDITSFRYKGLRVLSLAMAIAGL